MFTTARKLAVSCVTLLVALNFAAPAADAQQHNTGEYHAGNRRQAGGSAAGRGRARIAATRRARPLSMRHAGLNITTAQPSANTPYMGIDTWDAVGTNINQANVVQLINAAAADGLEQAGYRIVWLDAGWWEGSRNADGSIAVDPSQWPNGMAWLASYVHSRGFLAGIYEETGNTACYNGGALGHVQQDVDTFAAWGFDAVKVDYCGDEGSLLRPPAEVYSQFEQAIRTTGRSMILNACDPNTWDAYDLTGLDAWQWGPESGATSWRTNTDLTWPTDQALWPNLLRNLDSDAAEPVANGDGRGDPDYLIPGMLPFSQAQAQVTMWAMLAAPLMVSANPASMSPSTLATVTNPAVIAVDQDRLGLMAHPVKRVGSVQVWVKPLADSDEAVGLLNRGYRTERITVNPRALGLAGTLTVHDLWTGADWRTQRITLTLDPTSARLLVAR